MSKILELKDLSTDDYGLSKVFFLFFEFLYLFNYFCYLVSSCFLVNNDKKKKKKKTKQKVWKNKYFGSLGIVYIRLLQSC